MHRILLSLLAFISLSVQAQVQRYEDNKTREMFLQKIAHPPLQRIELVGQTQDERKRKFAEYFRDVVAPKDQEWLKVVAPLVGYSNLINMAAFRSEAEEKVWTEKMEEAETEYNRWRVDPEWTAILAEWARLGEGLTGTLAEDARRKYRDRKLEEMPEEAKPLLDEISNLTRDWEEALRKAPARDDIAAWNVEGQRITVAFKNGEMSFLEAKHLMDELNARRGAHVQALQAIEKVPNHLNRIAVLRSKVAKMKGFNTWAELALSIGDVGYTAELKGPANQRKFLHTYLKALAPMVNSFMRSRLQALGAEGVTVNESHYRLIGLPSLPMLSAYFPKEKVTDIWEETLLESGFKPQTLAQIFVDDSNRPFKDVNTAYQQTMVAPSPEVLRYELDTLEPMPNNPSDIRDGFAVVVQTWKSGGPNDLNTAFHEGGHSLEGIESKQNRLADVSYGSVEIPSMTSERFASDSLVLFHKAVAVNGERPTLERINELVQNYQKNESLQLRSMAMSALFDLNLWDYDYEQEGAETFLQRVVSQWQDVSERGGSLPAMNGEFPMVYGHISTAHYTSGDVRDIGYTFAEIGSRMATKFLTDEIEKLSGRRTWWRQPLLGKLFTEHILEKLWQDPFPTNIEKITGMKFDPEQVLAELALELGLDVSSSSTNAVVPTRSCEDEIRH